jgi:hypothetical protein
MRTWATAIVFSGRWRNGDGHSWPVASEVVADQRKAVHNQSFTARMSRSS